MSVIIRGMKYPESCYDCKFRYEGIHDYCIVTDNDFDDEDPDDMENDNWHPDWCPLSPVKKFYEEMIPGLFCDCKELGPCCDYSENEDCPKRKDDGSCWVSLEEADG